MTTKWIIEARPSRAFLAQCGRYTGTIVFGWKLARISEEGRTRDELLDIMTRLRKRGARYRVREIS